MRKVLFLAAAIPLVSVGMLIAQPQAASQGTASATGESETRGCLQTSNGGLILRSDDGATYMLEGGPAQLSKLVGKQVLIRGIKGSPTGGSTNVPQNSGGTSNNPSAGAGPTIQVITATKLTDRCVKK